MSQSPVRPNPQRRRRRRRRKNYRPLILLALAVVLTAVLIWLLVWGIGSLISNDDPVQTDPVHTTSPQTDPPPSSSEPAVTEPVETTPLDVVEAFAQQNGLSMEDYPEKLLLLLQRNPQTLDYVLNFPLEYGKDHEIDISDHIDDEGVPLFIQWDKQWGYRDYVGNVAGLSGCGPTCLSMLVFHYTRNPAMHPAYMMEFAEANPTYANKNTATQWALFSQGATEFGLDVKELTGEQIRNEDKLAQVLESGRLVVLNVGPGVFTEIGHYLLVVGYEDGKFRVNDPNSPANSEKLWDYEEFGDTIKMGWSFSD